MIAIVIPTLNEPRLSETLAALAAQTARDLVEEIIVVGVQQNWSPPPGVQFVQTPQPVTAAEGRNLGAASARAADIVFLDADCIPQPDFVACMAGALADGVVVGGAMILEQKPYWLMCDNALVFARSLSGAPRGECDYLPSFALGLRRALFERVGGFDPAFFGRGGIAEDVDWSFRARELGARLLFEPSAQVAHRPARASASAVWRHLRLFGRGWAQMAQTHPRLARSPITRAPGWLRQMAALAGPLLAAKDVLGVFAANPHLRAFWRAAPGMWWGKLAWYVGVANL